jgi:Zn finger protein HypA/HybF involved in hydrogenase expression
MRELGFGIYDPSNRAGDGRRSAYRRMTIDDVNELVEFTHQPYMYQRQEQKILKRFHDLGCGIPGELSRSNQQAISVLRFALQAIASWYGKGGEAAKEIMDFAESAGNVSSGEYYRGETYLRFAPDEEIAPSEDCLIGTWLEYKVRVSGSYKNALWSDLERMEVSNSYSYGEFFVDAYFVDESGRPIPDAFSYKDECYVVFRMKNYFGGDKETADGNLLRCRALAGLIDFLATLHLCEVELRVVDCVIAHQTNTLIAQAWRVAFEALSEITQRNDKYGHRKLKYRVFCCADCKSPRIVKRGKSAVRCPLCSNNNTKEHKNSKRNVY